MLYHASMKRTQIQLDERTFEKLRERAYRNHESIAGIIRSMVEGYIGKKQTSGMKTPPAFSFVGSGRSRGKRSGGISERHDEELTGAFSS